MERNTSEGTALPLGGARLGPRQPLLPGFNPDPSIERTWNVELPGDNLELHVESCPPWAYGIGHGIPAVGGDRITMSASTDTDRATLVELAGRYWSAETTETFTGRVIGIYAREGEVGLWKYTLSRLRAPEQAAPTVAAT